MNWKKIDKKYELKLTEITKIFHHPNDQDLKYMLIPPLNLTLRNSECVVIKGPSGSGKTTLLNIIVGNLSPSSGYVSINSKKIIHFSRKDRVLFRRTIGYIDQYAENNISLDLSADENLHYFLFTRRKKDRAYHSQIFEDLLERLNISSLREAPLVHLSGGELQRMMIAIVLSTLPDILVCDEPSAHLDSVHRKLVWDLIQEYIEESGAVGIITTHDLTHPQFTHSIDLVSRSW